MAKTEAAKRAKMMRKEWWKSKSTEATINNLIGLGVLHNRELAGWRPAGGDNYPNPQPSEIVVIEDFFKRGFGVPIHPFLQGLCLYYEIGIYNLHPNSIFLVSVFIHLCEVYGGIQPHFDLFRYMFCLRKKGYQGGSKIVSRVYLTLRDRMKQEYLNCPWNTSLTNWYKKWFYIREEPDSTMLCDVRYIPEKSRLEQATRADWASGGAVALLLWNRLDGPAVAGNFISRWVQPCQRRVQAGYEYQGSADHTRTWSEDLDHDGVVC
jgi:hypothetical protein